MVDEIEFINMEYDEPRDTPVVVRLSPSFNYFFICHAKSYQNAFRKDVNKFETRSDAIEFAEDHDCEVLWHDFDILQGKECKVRK